MKFFLILAILCSAYYTTQAQQNFIIWHENQPLQWLDFSGPVKDSSTFDAESFAEVRFSYKFNSLRDFNFDVVANFNRSISWSRKELQSEELLKHEQLHFDIAGLYAKKLKEAFLSYNYSSDYRNQIQQIFNQKKKEYHLVQQQYDEETNHSLNKERQKYWEKFISDELNGVRFKLDYVNK